jgi:hypothetical protein
LLRAIAAAVEDRDFNVRELFAFVEVSGGDLARLLDGISTRRLGKLLHRIAGQAFGDLVVDRIGSDRDGAIWRVAGVEQTRRGSV